MQQIQQHQQHNLHVRNPCREPDIIGHSCH